MALLKMNENLEEMLGSKKQKKARRKNANGR